MYVYVCIFVCMYICIYISKVMQIFIKKRQPFKLFSYETCCGLSASK